jgi:type I restriction enzyme S subunit
VTVLGDVLTFVGKPEKITDPADERFVTVRLNGGGAVERKIGAGKTPVAFTGYRVRRGQFIYSRIDARNGAFAIIPDHLDGAVVSKDFPIFQICERRVLPNYLRHFFRSGRLEQAIRARSRGATNRQRIKEDEFLGFPIEVPPIPEQHRIAAILDQADALRAKRRQVLTHFDRLEESVTYRFFANESPTAHGPLGEVAEKVAVGHVGPTSVHFRESGVPFLRTANVGDGKIIRDGLAHVTAEFHERLKKSQLRRDDVVISRVITDRVRAAVLPGDLDGANCANIILVRPSNRIHAVTIRAYLGLPTTQRKLLGRRVGSAQGVVNTTVLKELLVPIYPEPSQREFAAQTGRVSAQRVAVERALALDAELFASLQSRAFRGEL